MTETHKKAILVASTILMIVLGTAMAFSGGSKTTGENPTPAPVMPRVDADSEKLDRLRDKYKGY